MSAACSTSLHARGAIGPWLRAWQRERGTDKNQGAAIPLYQKACDGDDPRAATTSALPSDLAKGPRAMTPKPLCFFALGCEGDDAQACVELGRMQFAGLDVSRLTHPLK